MNGQTHRIYRLDGIEIDTSRVCLKRDGQEQHVRQKSFQVLMYLLEHRDRLVTKNELVDEIWAAAAVTDNTLEQCLADIRKVLRDNSRNPLFIKTIRGVGYRFIGAVEELEPAPAKGVRTNHQATVAPAPAGDPVIPDVRLTTPRWFRQRWLFTLSVIGLIAIAIVTIILVRKRNVGDSLVSMTLPQDPSRRPVAVMFFENESGNADLDWLREGLPDMIITELSRSKTLAVLSRQQLHVLLERTGHNQADKISLDEALKIARQTQAKLVVLGSFARLGDQIRIDVHLHDARDGQLLTAERLVVDQPAQILTQVDVLALKLGSYIGGRSPSESKAELSRVMTNNLEAYRHYSLGVEMAQALRNEEALVLLQKAVTLDPDFAMAYARIGYVHGITGNSTEEAKPYLQKAFQLTNRLTEKDRLSITAWYAIANYDYAGAINAFRQIIAGYPLEVEAYRRLALLLKGEVKYDEAIEILKQALVVDPGARDLYNALGSAYSETGRHNQAIAMFQRYVQLAPDEPNAHDSLGLGYQWAGRYDEAIQEYERALALKPNFEIAIVHVANVYFQQGRYRAAIDQYQRYLKSAPTDAERMRAYVCISTVELRRGQLESAERAARLALTYHKTAFGIGYLIALEKNDLAQATRLKQELEQDQSNDRGVRLSLRPLYYWRGLFALKTGATADAVDNFKLVVNHRPQAWHLESWEDCLGNAYLQLGRLDEAVAEYERILKLNPNYPLVHYHLAQAYEHQGQRDQARYEYEQFLEKWKDADADVPEMIAAKKALAS
ncbi:MAG TPA: tetratricopeptide repeat protein [Pyrinomonadaceae bacterium]|nr:tetratricopeptide repeat protein [Pyrinomonadaceae bacterium]